MTNEFRKKAVELGKLMNNKSKLSVPLVKCIIECFEIVFSEQDIDYMLLMKDGYYSRDELKELWQLDGDAFEKVFTSIRDKGGIWESRQEGVYDITPIFPGWVELYASGPLNDKRRQLLIKFAEFEELLIKLNIAPVRMYMNRVNERNMQREQGRMSTLIPDSANNLSAKKRIIKINKNVDAVQAVYTEGEVMDILNRNKEHIAVMNCFCRTKKMLENGKCDYDMPIESCMAVRRMAVQLEKAGVARHISIDEARKLIDTLEKKGCIHTLYHYGTYSGNEEIVLCNCCIDCCFLYGSFREGALSQLMIKAFYRPQIVDNAKCTGCNRCACFCPTNATWYDKERAELVYDIDRCIGCGQCVTQCPSGYRSMVKDERNIFVKTRKKVDYGRNL